MDDMLKNAVLSSFESDLMREYLTEDIESLEDLSEFRVINILLGAEMPISEKARLFEELARVYPPKETDTRSHSLCSYEAYAEMFRSAIENMEYREDERAVYYLKTFEWMREADYHLFVTFEAAIEFAKQQSSSLLKCSDEVFWHYEIEKWIPSENGAMKETFDYLISPDGKVLSADYSDRHELLANYFSNSDHVNVPVPFKPGDIVTLDCMPYAPIKHCVTVTLGDNWDCCSVECVYLITDDDYDDTGMADTSAFKHAGFFDLLPRSPLYKADILKGELPDEEKFLYGLSEVIKNSSADEEHIWLLLRDMVGTVPKDELAERLAEALNE